MNSGMHNTPEYLVVRPRAHAHSMRHYPWEHPPNIHFRDIPHLRRKWERRHEACNAQRYSACESRCIAWLGVDTVGPLDPHLHAPYARRLPFAHLQLCAEPFSVFPRPLPQNVVLVDGVWLVVRIALAVGIQTWERRCCCYGRDEVGADRVPADHSVCPDKVLGVAVRAQGNQGPVQ